jgi:hypothetical protein|tara:strand:- start:663 stop:1034 length:372 start_codon:yes stop_codon:yes gene_type:complete
MEYTAKAINVPAPAKELVLLGIAKKNPERYEQMKTYAKENPNLAAMTGFPADMFDRVDAFMAGEEDESASKKPKGRDPETGVVVVAPETDVVFAVEKEKSNTLMWVLAGVGALGVGYYLYTRR